MPRSWLLTLLLITGQASTAMAQPEVDSMRLSRKLELAGTPVLRIRALLDLAYFNLYKPASTKTDFEKAGTMIDEALQLTREKKMRILENDALVLLGCKQIRMLDSLASANTFMEVIRYYQTTGNIDKEAETWYRYGLRFFIQNYFTFRPYSFPSLHSKYADEVISAFQKASVLARKARNRHLQLLVSTTLAYTKLSHRSLTDFEAETRNALSLTKYSDTVKKHELLHMLMYANFHRGVNDSTLYFALESLKEAERSGHESDQGFINVYLGTIYNNKGKYKEAVASFEKYYYLCEKYKKPYDPTYLRFYAAVLERLGRTDEAAQFVGKLDINNRFYKQQHKTELLQARGLIYKQLKRWDESEFNYLQVLKLKENGSPQELMVLYINLGELYVRSGKYDKARFYLEKALKVTNSPTQLLNLKAVRKYLFHADTAQGKYTSAINHLLAFSRLSDSLDKQNSRKIVDELMIKYQTVKKENEIQQLTDQVNMHRYDSIAKEKDLLLLNSRISLQQSETDRTQKDIQIRNQDIVLLTKENQVQLSQLGKANTSRIIVIAGSMLLLIITGLLYHQYKTRKKASNIIRQKNETLKQLVDEKELLVKEIHHRVKNNLQMVVSLLESQSAYLKDDALLAIQDSQHRIHMMSALHQNLYQENNPATIYMDTYIPQMISYLRNSFNVGDSIRFNVHVSAVKLNVSQAVPIGLMLNEAVTNAIKYAFPAGIVSQPCIDISLQPTENGELEFVIADNGVGLPPDMDIAAGKGLGLKLIRGLAEDDMEGTLTVGSENGTRISIRFIPVETIALNSTDKRTSV